MKKIVQRDIQKLKVDENIVEEQRLGQGKNITFNFTIMRTKMYFVNNISIKKNIRKRNSFLTKEKNSDLKFGSDKTVRALIQVFYTNAPINDALEFIVRATKLFYVKDVLDRKKFYFPYRYMKKQNYVKNVYLQFFSQLFHFNNVIFKIY